MAKIIKVLLTDFNSLPYKLKKMDEELLLCFDLKEKDLTKETGNKILIFLNNLNTKNIKFKISIPLPRCLFGLRYDEIVKKFNIPKNCFECQDLFTVEKDTIKSCDAINKKGPKIYYVSERQQIGEYFNTLKMKKEPSKRCKSCLYFKRKQCDALCFVK